MDFTTADEARLFSFFMGETGGSWYQINQGYNNNFLGNILPNSFENVYKHDVYVPTLDIYVGFHFENFRYKKMCSGDSNQLKTPRETLDSCSTYSVSAYGEIVFTIKQKDKNNKEKESILFTRSWKGEKICDLPIPIGSTACTLIDAEPGTVISYKENCELLKKAMEKHPTDMVSVGDGVYIINGNLYSGVCKKDMKPNILFHHIAPSSDDTRHPFKIISNILCSATIRISRNVRIITEPTKKGTSQRISLNSEPLRALSFGIRIIFNIFDLFDEYIMIQCIMKNVSAGSYETILSVLLEILETSEDKICSNTQELIEYINSMASPTLVSQIMFNRVGDKLPHTLLYKKLKTALFINIDYTKKPFQIINMIGEIIASCIKYYVTDSQGTDALKHKKIQNTHKRRYLKLSQIEDPSYNINKKMTKTTYRYIIYPIKKRLETAYSKENIPKNHNPAIPLFDIDNIHDCWNQDAMSTTLGQLTYTRFDATKTAIEETVYTWLPGYELTAHIIRTGTVQMFKEFNSEMQNATSRIPSIDTAMYFCISSTAEGDPGRSSLLTPTVILPCYNIDNTVISDFFRDYDKYTNDPTDIPVKYNWETLGRVNNASDFVKYIRNGRRTNKKLASITYSIDPINPDCINLEVSSGGIPKIPLLIVESNLEEVIEKNNPALFHQRLKLDSNKLKEILEREDAMDYLIENDYVEYVSPSEVTSMTIACSMNEFIMNKNNIHRIYHRVVMSIQLYSINTGSNPNINRAPMPRSIIAFSQSKGAIGFQNANNAPQKKNMGCPTIQVPYALTSASPFIMPTTMNMFVLYGPSHGAQEDGVAMNTHSMAAGAGATYSTELISHKLESNETIVPLQQILENKDNKLKKDIPSYIDKCGLPMIGTLLYNGCTLFFKATSRIVSWSDIIYDKPVPGYLINIIRPQDKRDTIVFIFEQYYAFGLTSKQSSLCGNKGVISKLIRRADMPTTSNGFQPVLIMSPDMCFRRDIQDININLNSYYCLEEGIFIIYSIDQLPPKYMPSKDFLKRHNMDDNLMFTLYDKHGYKIENKMSIVIVPLRRISKMGILETYHTSNPRIDVHTHLPVGGGRNSNGTFSLSEMDKMLLHCRGSTLYSSATLSDRTTVYVCQHCNRQALPTSTPYCITCDSDATQAYQMSKSGNALIQCANANNIEISIKSNTISFNDILERN